MDEELAKNLLAIWQSELTAIATDRELQESWVAMVGVWAQAANAAVTAFSHEAASTSTVCAQPPRPTTSNAASGTGLDEVEALNKRVRELERRLAELLEQPSAAKPAGK